MPSCGNRYCSGRLNSLCSLNIFFLTQCWHALITGLQQISALCATFIPIVCESVQVHEKSILLALLPVTLLAFEEPVVAAWLPVWATVSMYPLLKKDGLSTAYLACLFLWFAIASGVDSRPRNARPPDSSSSHVSTGNVGAAKSNIQGKAMGQVSGQKCLHCLSLLSVLPAVCIHAAQLAVRPPVRFQHLYDAAFVSLAFMHVAATFVYLNVRQHVVAASPQNEV